MTPIKALVIEALRDISGENVEDFNKLPRYTCDEIIAGNLWGNREYIPQVTVWGRTYGSHDEPRAAAEVLGIDDALLREVIDSFTMLNEFIGDAHEKMVHRIENNAVQNYKDDE